MKLRRADELDFIFRDDYERNNEDDVDCYGDIWQKKSPKK